MNQINFNFENTDLIVDYITFKFDSLSNNLKQELINFLFEAGFNSTDVDDSKDWLSETVIEFDPKNSYNVNFVINYNPHDKGILVAFPGESGLAFYELVKKNQINWDLFRGSKLQRFDLNYGHAIDASETKNKIKTFLHDQHDILDEKKINVNLEGSSCLKIGSRRSNRCARIYVTKDNKILKFEMEIRRITIAPYKGFLVNGDFENFENQLTKIYLLYFSNMLSLNYSYMTWLAIKVRPMYLKRPSQTSTPYILSDYIKDANTILSVKDFAMFLKLIRYTRELDYETQYIDFDKVPYRTFTFKVRDFAKLCDSMFDSDDDDYKIQKTKNFFRKLQTKVFVQTFNDSEFIQILEDRLPCILRISFLNLNRCLLVRVPIMDALFYNHYPFRLPDLFELDLTNRKLNKHEYLVRCEIIKVFSSRSVEKKFLISQFFKRHRLSNQLTGKIKSQFVQMMKLLYEHNMIEFKVKLFLCQTTTNIDINIETNIEELSASNIGQGFLVYEKIIN
jgi:hypothetical protein